MKIEIDWKKRIVILFPENKKEFEELKTRKQELQNLFPKAKIKL